ncbi:molybdopterin-binding protein [Bacillus licheniformis]|nr:molybdopterin-binding protein [Bacillus licheniformis]
MTKALQRWKSFGQGGFLITTGGVSVGDFDFLPAIYEKLGAEVLFNKVAMRPGSVTTVAQLNGKLLFGLSGNPSACFVGFELSSSRPCAPGCIIRSRILYVQKRFSQGFPNLTRLRGLSARLYPFKTARFRRSLSVWINRAP